MSGLTFSFWISFLPNLVNGRLFKTMSLVTSTERRLAESIASISLDQNYATFFAIKDRDVSYRKGLTCDLKDSTPQNIGVIHTAVGYGTKSF